MMPVTAAVGEMIARRRAAALETSTPMLTARDLPAEAGEELVVAQAHSRSSSAQVDLRRADELRGRPIVSTSRVRAGARAGPW